MTSNHPEKLDPALIRPGRVNLKLYLGYIQLEEAKQMVEHYFGGYLVPPKLLTEAQLGLLAEVWQRFEGDDALIHLTPAQLEQLCSEYDEVDELLEGLKYISGGA
jgi:SpoVK/Ycf46/Vps4 family AAA+-type ATPase